MTKAKTEEAPKGLIVYETVSGEVKLSPAMVKQYLVSGSGNVSDQEVVMFMQLCKFQKLNPWLKEAYLIKYGNNSPATLIVGKDAFLKRAKANPTYQGHEVSYNSEDDTATARVHVEGYKVPIEVTVDLDEYEGKKADGTPNRTWAGKKKTMLKKVALVQALREAFPEDLSQLFTQEEVRKGDDVPVDLTETVKAAPAEPVEEAELSEENIQTAEPVPTPGPDAMTENQMKRVHILFKECGMADRDIRLAFASNLLERKILSTKDLDWKDAEALINRLLDVKEISGATG